MLRVIYPQKFQNLYQTTESINAAGKLWGKHLQEFDETIIGKAIDACPDRYTWIPEIAEFKALCQSFKGSSRLPWSEEVMKRVEADKPSNRNVTAEINIGAEITKKIKQLYPDKHWFKDIPEMFTKVKRQARKYFPNVDEMEVLQEIRKFSDEDFKDILEDA